MTLVFIRHSLRLDRVEGATWSDQHLRPYDTPVRCLELPAQQAQKLTQLNVRQVVVSPFRRCLQTAAVICRDLGINEVTIHREFGETMSCVREANADAFPHLDESEHKLEYLSMEESLSTVQSIHPHMTIADIVGEKPPYHESKEEGFQRMKRAAMHYHDHLREKHAAVSATSPEEDAKAAVGGLLVVTHAEVVNVLGSELSGSKIHSVDECGFVAFDVRRGSGAASVGSGDSNASGSGVDAGVGAGLPLVHRDGVRFRHEVVAEDGTVPRVTGCK